VPPYSLSSVRYESAMPTKGGLFSPPLPYPPFPPPSPEELQVRGVRINRLRQGPPNSPSIPPVDEKSPQGRKGSSPRLLFSSPEFLAPFFALIISLPNRPESPQAYPARPKETPICPHALRLPFLLPPPPKSVLLALTRTPSGGGFFGRN